jgi:hypothetical protein
MKEKFQYEIFSNLDSSTYIVKHNRKIENNKVKYDYIQFGHITTNKFCIEIHVYNQIHQKYAELSKIKYDKGCSIQKTLEKGIGTQNMLKVALSLVSELYPEIKYFTFRDYSEKECDNGANIHLGYFSLITSGKTWYEKNFGATIKDEIFKELYKKDLDKLNYKNIDIEISDILINNKVKLPLREIIIKEFEDSKNYKDFFKRLNTKFGRNMFCEYLQPWIRDFMSKLDLERYFFMEWEIPVKEIHNFNVIIKDYKRIDDGGGIRNRRNITNKLKGRRRWICF